MASLTSRPVYSRGTANSIHRTGGRMGPEPVWTFRRRGTPYVHSHGHRYTLSCMPTEIPYRVCPPVYLIVYAHLYNLSSMPTRIPYRLCPSIYLIVYVHWYPLNAKNPRFSAAIYECQRGEESGRSLSDCLGRCLHRSDARTTAPASRRCSVSSHFREEYSVTLHVTKNS